MFILIELLFCLPGLHDLVSGIQPFVPDLDSPKSPRRLWYSGAMVLILFMLITFFIGTGQQSKIKVVMKNMDKTKVYLESYKNQHEHYLERIEEPSLYNPYPQEQEPLWIDAQSLSLEEPVLTHNVFGLLFKSSNQLYAEKWLRHAGQVVYQRMSETEYQLSGLDAQGRYIQYYGERYILGSH